MESKSDLEVKLIKTTELIGFFKGIAENHHWKYFKEQYLDLIYKSLQNKLEEENDEMRLRQTQGAVRNMKYLFALPKKLERTQGELIKMIEKVKAKNAT